MAYAARTRRIAESESARRFDWSHERPLSSAVDATFQFIGVLAPDGTLLDANRTALSFVEATLDDVLGRPFWETPWWSTVEGQVWVRNAVADAAAGSLVRGEVEHSAPDGRLIYVDFSLTPLRDDDGSVRALLAEGRDLTERKHVEEALRVSEAEARAARGAAEAAEQRAFFLANASKVLGSSLNVDATFEQLTALIVPAVATFCIVDLVDERGSVRRLHVVDRRPTMQGAVHRLASYPRDRERPYLTKDALTIGTSQLVTRLDDAALATLSEDQEHLALLRELGPTSYMVVPLLARRRVLGAVAFCRDRSVPPFNEADLTMAEDLAHRAALALDNAHLYERSLRSTQARDDMLGLVSHDLRNPLAAISMCVSALLETEDSSAPRVASLLRSIRDSADLSHRLIQDLLDVSAIEAGRLSLERRPVDIMVIAVQAAELFEPIAQEQGIRLRLELPDFLPRVNADTERLVQALGNLLGNALKFTPSGGDVTIHGRSHARWVMLSVSDTGPGVPPADAPFIFDRYWHSRRTARAGGTGLGLAIAKGIVEAHEGRIWLESRAGAGSRFCISLPIV